MLPALKGIIHGRLIELDDEPGLPDGQIVNVTVEPTNAPTQVESTRARDALHWAAGSWADSPEDLERYLEWNRQQRKGSRREVSE